MFYQQHAQIVISCIKRQNTNKMIFFHLIKRILTKTTIKMCGFIFNKIGSMDSKIITLKTKDVFLLHYV